MEPEALPTPQAYPALAPLADALQTVLRLYPGMSSQTFMVFLLVVDKPGITSQEIVRKASIAQSSTSRNLARLSGYGLIKTAGSQAGIAAWPTEKGKALAQLITVDL